MSFPKKGKFFPGQDWGANGGESPDGRRYAAEIAAALHRALDSTRAGAKTAAGWTGADERTAKNWLSGRYGPSGMHLVALARNSDDVLNAFLAMAGRPDLVASAKLAAAEQAISELLSAVRSLNGKAK
ncbi:hypothetical protein [Rhodoplanes sp. SY1]|uniref:hypothetical protein n=1 Tax=Rhodoplanes sp. SY1 TaxID=3166646 RepID=UPI0038B56F60